MDSPISSRLSSSHASQETASAVKPGELANRAVVSAASVRPTLAASQSNDSRGQELPTRSLLTRDVRCMSNEIPSSEARPNKMQKTGNNSSQAALAGSLLGNTDRLDAVGGAGVSDQFKLSESQLAATLGCCVSEVDMDDESSHLVVPSGDITTVKLHEGEFLRTDGVASCVAIMVHQKLPDAIAKVAMVHANGMHIHMHDENDGSMGERYAAKIMDNFATTYNLSEGIATIHIVGGLSESKDDLKDCKMTLDCFTRLAEEKGFKIGTTVLPAVEVAGEYVDVTIGYGGSPCVVES